MTAVGIPRGVEGLTRIVAGLQEIGRGGVEATGFYQFA
jgi:hypothetical protein